MRKSEHYHLVHNGVTPGAPTSPSSGITDVAGWCSLASQLMQRTNVGLQQLQCEDLPVQFVREAAKHCHSVEDATRISLSIGCLPVVTSLWIIRRLSEALLHRLRKESAFTQNPSCCSCGIEEDLAHA